MLGWARRLNLRAVHARACRVRCFPKGPKLGFEYLPTYKTLHCVCIACALRARHSPCKVQLYTGHARCTHVQVASATLRYITRTVATQLATNTIIIFLLLNGCILLCPHRRRHMRPRFIFLIPGLPANTNLGKVEQNTHNMATSPVPSQGPHTGEKSLWLHHPCLLGVPIAGRVQYGGWKMGKKG